VKKKTITTLVLASTFMLLSGTSKVSAVDSLAEQLGIQVIGGGTIVMQGTPRIIKEIAVLDKKSTKHSATYSLSLKLIKEFENNGKILIRFKAGRGLGLDSKEGGGENLFTYAQLNSNVDPTLNDKGNTLIKISELFYQQSFIDNKLTVNFGKLDSGPFAENKYAKDKTSQFITGIFTTDKTLNAMPQNLALRLNYAILDVLDIAYAYSVKDINHIGNGGFNIIQATYKPFENGNYRAYIWTDNKNHHSYKNKQKSSGTYGLGISLDQKINKIFAVFCRFGYKNPSVGIKNASSGFELPLSMTWSIGTEIKETKSSNDQNVFGFAIGQIYGSSNLKKYGSSNLKKYKSTPETAIELYYKIKLNNHIAITPSVQYILNPKGGNLPSNNILIYGIRTQFDL
jgi:hypothetical protein